MFVCRIVSAGAGKHHRFSRLATVKLAEDRLLVPRASDMDTLRSMLSIAARLASMDGPDPFFDRRIHERKDRYRTARRIAGSRSLPRPRRPVGLTDPRGSRCDGVQDRAARRRGRYAPLGPAVPGGRLARCRLLSVLQ